MTTKEQLFILSVFITVVVTFVVNHFLAHLALTMEEFLALALPALCRLR